MKRDIEKELLDELRIRERKTFRCRALSLFFKFNQLFSAIMKSDLEAFNKFTIINEFVKNAIAQVNTSKFDTYIKYLLITNIKIKNRQANDILRQLLGAKEKENKFRPTNYLQNPEKYDYYTRLQKKQELEAFDPSI